MKHTTLGIAVFIISVIVGGYIGGYVLLVNPIVSACMAYDAGDLTATIVGLTIIKGVFAPVVVFLIVTCGTIGMCALMELDK